MIQINASTRLLTAHLTDDELAKYADLFWDWAKSTGSPLNPKFETWFKNRGRLTKILSDAEIDQIWRAALRMHS